MNERVYELIELVKNTAIQAGNVAADAAYGMGKLAEETLDRAKLRIRAAKVEGSIDGCMMEIGEMMYATHTGSPTDSDVLLEKLKEVDGLKALGVTIATDTVVGRTISIDELMEEQGF